MLQVICSVFDELRQEDSLRVIDSSLNITEETEDVLSGHETTFCGELHQEGQKEAILVAD